MTEVATLVLTASAITLVLQIVSIALIVDTRKKLKNEPELERPAAPEVSEVKKQREAENRFARKPQQELRNRPAPAQPQNVDQVERSLRDINLRLKNAERDQEKERKRIKDAIAPSGQGPRKFDQQKPRERDEGFRRNDRPRHDFHQNRNSDAPRQQRDDRNIPRNSFEVKDPAPAPQPPVVAAKPIPPAPPAPAVHVSPEPVFETAAASMEQKENLQHGRKVMVKRRILNLEEEKAAAREGSVQEGAASSSPVLPAATAPDANRSADVEITRSSEQEASEGSAPISFGR